MRFVVANILRSLKAFCQWLRVVWKKIGSAAVFWLVNILVHYVAVTLMSPWLDTLDRRSWQCEIVSAEPVQNRAGLRGSVSTPHILVKTKNCGSINVEGKSVNSDNWEQVAASFKPGSQWIFEIGWYSRFVGKLIERQSPSSEIYHKLAE